MTPDEQGQLVVSLGVMAIAMRAKVTAEQIAMLADDLAPYELDAVTAALQEHRRRSVYWPQLAELLPALDDRYRDNQVGASRGARSAGTTERISGASTCIHVPKCRTIGDCIDRTLGRVACRPCAGRGYVSVEPPVLCDVCGGRGRAKPADQMRALQAAGETNAEGAAVSTFDKDRSPHSVAGVQPARKVGRS